MISRTMARQRTLGGVAAVALLVLSACSGGGDGDGVASAGGDPAPANASATEDSAPRDPDAQALVFAECMRDNGIDMPDPGPGQQGLSAAFQAVAGGYHDEAVQQAIAACQDLMPQYESGDHSGDDWMLELAECLREQGLDVSDNPFEEAHSGAIDVGEFSAAMEICRDELTGADG
ncbi:MAG: hypothetical protein ACRD29_23730 [Acidimicrobiales bacterium]